MPIPELCREHGMSGASFYKWRAKFGGMDASMVSQMKSIDDENKRLKRMYAELIPKELGFDSLDAEQNQHSWQPQDCAAIFLGSGPID